MHFEKFRKYSVKIGNDNKLYMPSGKRRLHSVCGRYYDDREYYATDVFRKAYIAFSLIISDLYRVLTEFFKVHTDIARSI